MENLLKKLLKYEYITVNSDGKIVEISSGVQRFADTPENVKFGEEIAESFPELIGLEETWQDIRQGEIENFELQGITRSSTSAVSIYLDISIFKNPAYTQLNGEILILFEESTQDILQESQYSQIAKEYGLSISYLEQENQYLHQIIDSMTDLLIVTNQIGIIQSVNQATLNLLGYNKEELLKQFVSILFPSYSFPISFNPFNLISEGKTAYQIEIYCSNKFGQQIPISFSCSTISSDGNYFQDLLWIGRNVTEYKQLKSQLNQQLECNHLLYQISQQVYQSFHLEDILENTVEKIRVFLQRDWVMFYEFYSEFLGAIVAESYSSTVTPDLKNLPDDVLIPRKFIPLLNQGKICKVEYTHLSSIDPELRNQLTQFQIKSKLILPIQTSKLNSSNSNEHSLWGVLIIHQYNPTKSWETWEVNLLQQVVLQISIGNQKIDYYDQVLRGEQQINNSSGHDLN